VEWKNLAKEGVPADRCFFVGNVMIDTLMAARERAMQSGVIESLGLGGRPYGLLTLHRPSNVDDPAVLRALLDTLTRSRAICRWCPRAPADSRSSRSVRDQAGPGAPDTHRAARLPGLPQAHGQGEAGADRNSGGVQEETTVLGVPCLTLRDNTSDRRPSPMGPNRLAGTQRASILQAFATLPAETPGLRRSRRFGTDARPERVAEVLVNLFVTP